ncbi:MAG TPA: D-aminoacyl-tRNA deacylase [Terriglobia bacterium]|nr:D-aminoacyl-tRNA deacylase [Terriglobia bacterium]
MRAVIQRVSEARVLVGDAVVGAISHGLLVYLGVHQDDRKSDADYLVDKITGLRIFEDKPGKMNLELGQVGGELLVVSQFTLYGDCRRGKRPSFDKAAGLEVAKSLFEYFVEKCRGRQVTTRTGIFREMMRVFSVNEGPVTILLDSQKMF